ncbi:hypothetical protein ZWY2020_035286 [Hordeum vulgare]|nr:hypothetical protein ZWY2020_035286 [Hordeum vulgare]
MDSSSDAHSRNKCAACYRQFNRMEHLVEHMRASHHSPHEPRCGVCGKHCRSLDALRDHLGFGASLPPKPACARAFAAQGCPLCLAVFPSAGSLRAHSPTCHLSRAPVPSMPMPRTPVGGAVALGCKMVGAGNDGTLDVCARVCVIDEHEAIVYEKFVRPLLPVTHYRYETTGIRPEHLRDALAVKMVQRQVEDILLNGEQPWKRDTAVYPPLMKTSARLMSNSLRFLTQSCLGYDIQTGHQHPYEDCVAAMRLYKKMRAMRHGRPNNVGDGDGCAAKPFPTWRQRELERMSPEELLSMSKSDYHCWCLDN